jgi:two-component system CheB/CheR fusion protein
LVQKILSPYLTKQDGGDVPGLFVDGPSVTLGSQSVTTFALILHELATNAAKYGSLSVGTGSLGLKWICDGGTLVMKWEETGGPALSGPPQSEGFGTALSNRSIREQLGGALAHRWSEGGLAVEISIPLESLRR